ncbi:fungal pheromone STE3G-protein-coupled receptor [Schizopora paradoxa]|uniref:Fungal pheromone STE3G-protein-coupled receptor n=1 Tax=Schizopora paradoxa TaxID=27342 RepID=A0A0H2RCF4_9AGAM|nr:fungal pheromone STE3G-protein-coupled receptor [Schizopora paradoxa]
MNGLTPYPITPIGSFIGTILALLPLLSQVRKLSVGVWGYAIWVAMFNFIMFVNTIIWHDNTNVVATVWCDIATKLQVGSMGGSHACVFVICLHLYRITRYRASPDITKQQRHKKLFCELLLIIGLPVLVMALFIIAQPFRFQIVEEIGCLSAIYSYVGYVFQFGPSALASFGCAILAPLTLRTFLKHRKEMNEFLSSGRDITYNKYHRLMVIACLDTLLNVPVLITIILTTIIQGKNSSFNYPYVSWKNVHDGAGGNLPGFSLDSILQVSASDWSTDKWAIFTLKWNEWIYVLYAVVFFGVFGTTPEMRQYYRVAFWFVPERCGFRMKRASPTETLSDIAFDRDVEPQTRMGIGANTRQACPHF